MKRAKVFAPASIGNVGPGFDVLGLAVDGLGDTVEVTLGGEESIDISGRDADLVPLKGNAAVIAAKAYLKGRGGNVCLSLHKGLPLSGGLGGSAASSVGGALAAALALGGKVRMDEVLEAALAGEEAVAGRHYDNLAPCLHGGLVLVLPRDPPRLVQVPLKGTWWLALVTPATRLETKKARSVLPSLVDRKVWVAQMANTAALTLALSRGDSELAKHALQDVYAEPARAPLIPSFAEAKSAALKAGALGCSISGAGPTVFALTDSRLKALRCAKAMQRAFGEATLHVGQVSKRGARRVR